MAHGIGPNGKRRRTAIDDGLALPWGKLGQCVGAVRAGVCDSASFVCDGAADDMAQWWAPCRRQQAGSDASSPSIATASGPRPKSRTSRIEKMRRICHSCYMNFAVIRESCEPVAFRYHRFISISRYLVERLNALTSQNICLGKRVFRRCVKRAIAVANRVVWVWYCGQLGGTDSPGIEA